MTLRMKSRFKLSKIGELDFSFPFNSFIIGDIILSVMLSSFYEVCSDLQSLKLLIF